MILAEFTTKYDQETIIILLEGKRNVLESDKVKLEVRYNLWK
ncbi:hypothetical protein [Flavobacterium soyangense]|nr:hypothetical protein [Flavobacterium soyangense]